MCNIKNLGKFDVEDVIKSSSINYLNISNLRK